MKWAKQGFLNSAHSYNNGRYKFSIMPGTGVNLTHRIHYMIADCSNDIELEFNPPYVTADATVEDLTNALFKLHRRRKKLERFDKAIRKAHEKMLKAMDKDEQTITTLLAKARKESRRPAKMKAGS